MNTSQEIGKEGIPIFLLKTRSIPNDGYEETFSAVQDGLRFEPTFVPVLEHKFLTDGLTVVQELLQGKKIGQNGDAKYGGMIFTSQRAVEAFAKLVEEGKGDANWPHLQDAPIYTVGPATSRALRSILQTPPLNIFGSETGNGEALAHYMLEHYGEWYKDREAKPALLFLVGEQRRDIIPKTLMDPSLPDQRRIHVDERVVYGTGVMESFEVDFMRHLENTREKKTRWVVVFSPTGCEAMLRAMGLLDQDGRAKAETQSLKSRTTYIATIGPTTRDFLRETFGFEPDVCAQKPSPEGVEESIKKFLRDQS